MILTVQVGFLELVLIGMGIMASVLGGIILYLLNQINKNRRDIKELGERQTQFFVRIFGLPDEDDQSEFDVYDERIDSLADEQTTLESKVSDIKETVEDTQGEVKQHAEETNESLRQIQRQLDIDIDRPTEPEFDDDD